MQLKPQNILVKYDFPTHRTMFALSDLGCAQQLPSGLTALEEASIGGSEHFFAPERALQG